MSIPADHFHTSMKAIQEFMQRKIMYKHRNLPNLGVEIIAKELREWSKQWPLLIPLSLS